MSRLQTRMVEQATGAGPERLGPEAFAQAFVASSRTLWCIAVAVLGDRGHAEDVLQEGAMIALGKLDQFQPGTSFVAWMGRIVQYVALNHARRRSRAPVPVIDPESLESARSGPDAPPPPPVSGRGELAGDQTAFDDQVLAALGTLGEIPRACVLLRTLLEMPYRDIALALGIPEGTAMSHVHRARRSLRERLRDRAPDPTRVERDS